MAGRRARSRPTDYSGEGAAGPVFGAIVAASFFGEPVGVTLLVGCALILGGVVVGQLRRRRGRLLQGGRRSA